MRKLERQANYQEALSRALECVRRRPAQNLAALGAREAPSQRLELPVLERIFLIDLGAGTVALSDGRGAASEESLGIGWKILALHYLSADVPWPPCGAWISFGDMPEARGYKTVYEARVIERLCATAGCDRDRLVGACARLGARRLSLGNEGFRFQFFPQLEVRLAWYAGDEELGPGISFLYPDNVLCFLSVEDVTVLSESLVGRLNKMGW